MSERSLNLAKEWDKLKQKGIISIKDFEGLSVFIQYVMDRVEEVEKSRDSWKSKYELRNDDVKDYAKTITKLQNQLNKKEVKNGNTRFNESKDRH